MNQVAAPGLHSDSAPPVGRIERLLPEILFFSGIALGLSVLLLQKLFHDDFGEIDLAARRHWFAIFHPRNVEVLYHYNPVRGVCFSVLYSLGGTCPLPYHAFSLVMHVMYVAGWYAISARISTSRPLRMIMALVACFTTLGSEAVFWVGANDQVIGAAIYVWALWAGLRYLETKERRFLWIGAPAAAVGLFTIELVITLPITILAFAIAGRHAIHWKGAAWKLALALGLIWGVYLALHSIGTDREVLEREGYKLSLGKHNLENMVFALQVTMTSATVLHRCSLNGFYEQYYEIIYENTWPQVLMMALVGAALVWGRTRPYAVWLVIAILPYTFRPSHPQPARYYLMPVGIFLLLLLAVLDSISRWSRACSAIFVVGGLALATSTIHAWHHVQHPYYLGLGERAEAALGKVLARPPRSYRDTSGILVFGDLPFALRYVIGPAVRTWMLTDGQYFENVEYFPDYSSFSYADRDPELRGREWHIVSDYTLLRGDQEPSEYEQDGRIDTATPGEQSEGQLAWKGKSPFPGFLVWRFSCQGEESMAASPLVVMIAECSVEDPGQTPERVTIYRIDRPAGRIRLPRPLHNHDWVRISLVGWSEAGCHLELLRLEAV